ncbi:MAG: hypothetical protein JO297_11940 [Nitrososphaeraceae archaeon]|nr:hypothetical protein [Nitrososphaeraceae archaeon]
MLQLLLVLFERNKKSKWKIKYEYSIYKVYDSNKKLAGYFFPQYDSIQHHSNEQGYKDQDQEDKIIDIMNKAHEKVRGGNLMVPMLKLNLLDNTEGIDLDYTIEALDGNLQRAKTWKEWLEINHTNFSISGAAVYTAREDRNMLSIVFGINLEMILGEKELEIDLTPLLDKLHTDGML